ncbi:hypothetical protein O181_074452 [Austropuccinia psidii MF-1]|uniref:STAS domain-containing protein n=1 Tax=Austropuccinia psidii MF-1 TaxID=1389203 RepID=A0A9Q3FD27_9BASI|nr:hypothetical protein [Austropuccinia psidii MF-1]
MSIIHHHLHHLQQESSHQEFNNSNSTSSASSSYFNNQVQTNETTKLLSNPSVNSNLNKSYKIFLLKRLNYYIPATDWIPHYSIKDLFHDSISGITIACLLIPQSIGYASQLAQIPPINGLFSAAIPAIIYPLLCTGRTVSVGPEAALSLLVGQNIKQIIHNQNHQSNQNISNQDLIQLSLTISTLLTLETGLISFLFGFFRLGFLDAILSKALLRGFVSAIAIIIAIEQLPILLGLNSLEKLDKINSFNIIDKLIWVISNILKSHHFTCLISFFTLISILIIKKLKTSTYSKKFIPLIKFLPEILLITTISSFLTDLFNWQNFGIDVLGHVSISQVKLGLPWNQISKQLVDDTIGTAFTLCICGLVDSIVAAKAEAAVSHYSISSNRELVALGLANITTSFIQGDMPAYGSITRSRLNTSTGARTPLASIITGLTIILASYFFLDYLFFLPKCVLAVIIVLVVINLLSELPQDLIFFWKLNGWTELALMTFTFFLTLAFDIKTGILISVGVSLILTVKDATGIRVRILGRNPISHTWEPIDPKKTQTEESAREIEEEIPGVLIVKIRESLSFANAGGLKERLRRLEMFGHQRRHPSDDRERENTRMIVFHLGDVEQIDASALQILKEVFKEYIDRGVDVWMCHIHPRRLEILKKAGIIDVVGNERILSDVNQVLKAAQKVCSLALEENQQVEDLLLNERDDYLAI